MQSVIAYEGYGVGAPRKSCTPGPVPVTSPDAVQTRELSQARDALAPAKPSSRIVQRAARKAAHLLYRYAGIQDELRRSPYVEAHHRTRSVFIHVPKTGGNSVTRMIYGVPSLAVGGHTPARRFLEYWPGLYSHYLVFATVRHPWDMLASAFRYLKTGGMTPVDRHWTARHLAAFDSFESFVRALADEAMQQRILTGIHFKRQTDYLCDAEGRLIVNRFVRMEDFETGMRAVCRQLNIRYAPVHLNATPAGTDRAAAEARPELEQICYSLYRKDYQLLHYRPPTA